MGRKPYKSPEEIQKEKLKRAELEEAMHRVIFLCQITGIPKESALQIVRDRCLTGYKEAGRAIERYWQDGIEPVEIPGEETEKEK
ncbi:MAG: hypothetical protein ACI4AA_10050 [Lachnospiraceae bacterium]